jgi:hypothetical protein
MSGTAPDQLPGRTPRAAQMQAFAAPPPLLVVPPPIPVPAIYPNRLPGVPARAAYMQAFAGPPKAVTAPTPQQIQPIVPFRLPGSPRRAHEYQAFASPQHFVTPVTPPIPGYGPAGAATFILSLEPGTKVTYSWPTAIFKSYSGNEQRISPNALPKLKIEGVAYLLEASSRDTRTALMRAAAQGSTFLLALPYEELQISADSPNSTVTVTSTANVDWAQSGQRALIIAPDGSTVTVVVQSTTSTTISIAIFDASGTPTFGVLGASGRSGGRIMPLVQVLLDPQQGFARYPTAVDLWSIHATVSVFGWTGIDAVGLGTTVTTYLGGLTPVASVTDADYLIWDRSNAIDGTVNEAMLSLGEIVDLGGVPFGAGAATTPDWTRTIKYTSSSWDDWQWIKAFLRRIRGAQVAFGLSTGRTDLLFVGADNSVTPQGIKISSGSVAGGGDYTAWFASSSYRRLALTLASGAQQYVTISALRDNGDGTLTLTMDQGLNGTVTRISFLEQIRLETGDVEVTWDGGTFDVEVTGRVSRETVTIPAGPMFETFISVNDPSTSPPSSRSISVPSSRTVYIAWTGVRLAHIGAFISPSQLDGDIICLKNHNTDTTGMILTLEDTTMPAASRIKALSSLSGGPDAVFWVRYDGTAQRWVIIMTTLGAPS